MDATTPAPTPARRFFRAPMYPRDWRTLTFLSLGVYAVAIMMAALHRHDDYVASVGLATGMALVSCLAWRAGREGMLRNQDPAPRPVDRRGSEAAVSPVIGVILMVAITVVLAAIVFVLVTHLADTNSTNAPQASFNFVGQDASSLSFQMISQTQAFNWTTCLIRDNTGALHTFTVNGLAPTTTPSTAGDVVKVTGLTTKTTYQLALLCNNQTVGQLTGTTQ